MALSAGTSVTRCRHRRTVSLINFICLSSAQEEGQNKSYPKWAFVLILQNQSHSLKKLKKKQTHGFVPTFCNFFHFNPQKFVIRVIKQTAFRLNAKYNISLQVDIAFKKGIWPWKRRSLLINYWVQFYRVDGSINYVNRSNNSYL